MSPHIAVIPYFVSNDYLHITSPKLDRAENSLDENFAEWGDKAEAPVKTMFYLYKENTPGELEKDETDATQKEIEFKRLKEDFLVQTAIKMLMGNPGRDFAGLLKKALSLVEKEQENQEKILITQFAGSSPSIDWQPYDQSPKGQITSKAWLEIKSKSGKKETWKKHNGMIPADSEFRLYLGVKNRGKSQISRLIAITTCEDTIFDDRQFAFGKLDPGQSKHWYVPIKISESSYSRSDLVKFVFTDQQERVIHSNSITLNIKQQKRPEFLYEISILENGENQSKGNGDGKIQVDETVAVKITIVNKGKGTSGALTAMLKNGEGKRIFLKIGRQTLEKISPGESRIAYFQFDLKSRPEDSNLDFSLDIIDSIFSQSSLNQKIKMPLDEKVIAISNMPPSIKINTKALTSTTKEYRLHGLVSDQKGVKDVYIFANKKKIYYRNYLNSNQRTTINFRLTINLDKEINRIIVISRDDENVIAQKSLLVRYTPTK